MKTVDTTSAKKGEPILKIVIGERVSVRANLSGKQVAIVVMVLAALLGFPYLPELIAVLGSVFQ